MKLGQIIILCWQILIKWTEFNFDIEILPDDFLYTLFNRGCKSSVLTFIEEEKNTVNLPLVMKEQSWSHSAILEDDHSWMGFRWFLVSLHCQEEELVGWSPNVFQTWGVPSELYPGEIVLTLQQIQSGAAQNLVPEQLSSDWNGFGPYSEMNQTWDARL